MPPPTPRPITSWRDAELNAAEWARYWGYVDVTARPGGPDGGIDLHGKNVLGQVKFQASQVGRPELQRLVGARGNQTDKALAFFAATGYSTTAAQYADEMRIGLFTYDLTGKVVAVNTHAQAIAAGSESARSVPWKGKSRAPAISNRDLKLFIVFAFVAPFGPFMDDRLREWMYTGPVVLDVIKFIGLLLACWALALGAGIALDNRKGGR